MEKNGTKMKISFNSPVVLTFSIICLAVLIIGTILPDQFMLKFFSVYRAPLSDPLTYFRFFSHICGHAGWDHFIGNITMLLVVGPMLEEKYGSKNILFVILATAFITGLFHFIFFTNSALLGASGVVFAFILLSSFTSIRDGRIPLTFILVVLIYIGGQIYDGIFVKDNVSNITHIIGGGVGSGLGYVMAKNKMDNYH
ncbi:MAG: rhomboid family intramembrane serine protease [Ruminococcus sp.]|nr:rhomboid family intramembrane serine protease [Ruminococcus sp.]